MEEGPRRAVGKVIKGDGGVEPVERSVLRPPRPGVLNAEEYEARTTAQRIVDEAHRAAEDIKAEAEAKRAEVYEQAKLQARAEVMAAANGELARAKMQAGQLLVGAQRDIVELACKIAEKIIGSDLARDPDVVLRICATATETVRTAKAMVLRVNPKDGAYAREKRPRLMELVGRTIDIAIKDDPEVEPGGCVVETEFGIVDAQLRTQFEMLKNVLVPDPGKKDGPA